MLSQLVHCIASEFYWNAEAIAELRRLLDVVAEKRPDLLALANAAEGAGDTIQIERLWHEAMGSLEAMVKSGTLPRIGDTSD